MTVAQLANDLGMEAIELRVLAFSQGLDLDDVSPAQLVDLGVYLKTLLTIKELIESGDLNEDEAMTALDAANKKLEKAFA